MKGEEAEEAKRGRGNKTADLRGINRVEIEILNFRPDESVFAQCLVEALLDKAGMDAGEVDKVEIKTGLGSSGDNEQGNKGEGHGAVPKKAADHENEKEVETVEELFVVGVLHLAHPTELIHPKGDLLVGLWHSPFMPSEEPKDNLATVSEWWPKKSIQKVKA